jgi:hypothetical protein
MRDWLMAETDTPHWQAWGQLYEGGRSGRTVVPEQFGMQIYEYYTAHPAELACFSRAMGNISALVANGTVQNYDFSRARQIVDVGGEMAVFCSQFRMLTLMCTARCSTGPRWWKLHVRRSMPRIIKHVAKLVDGDFFQAVPGGGDLYVLKFSLVDWKDAETLRFCRSAARPPLRTASWLCRPAGWIQF